MRWRAALLMASPTAVPGEASSALWGSLAAIQSMPPAITTISTAPIHCPSRSRILDHIMVDPLFGCRDPLRRLCEDAPPRRRGYIVAFRRSSRCTGL
jgi:hypothetical protein